MSDIIPKYAGFIDLLLSKTKESKINWVYDGDRSCISVWNGDVLLSITRVEDGNYEHTYAVTLHNRSGVCLESFDDSTISGVAVDWQTDNYYVRLQNLFNLGMRQATGADKALDDFIKAVQTDSLDDIPF